MFVAILSYGALTIFMGELAYWRLFTFLAPYDDEGYLLVSLQSFVRGGSLYSDVFSQYGPFYYELFGGLFRLTGRPITMNSGRLIVEAIWLASSLLCGIAAHRLSGRLVVGLGSTIVAFGVLVGLVPEPMHPGGLLCLLLTLTAATSVLVLPLRPRAGAAIVGILSACIALTKLNVGGLVVLAIFFAASVTLDYRWRRTAAPLMAAAFCALPLALLSADLANPPLLRFALSVSLGGLALAVVTIDRIPATLAARGLVHPFGAGFLGTTALVTIAIVADGTSPGDLVRGVFIEPTRLRSILLVPLSTPGWMPVWAFASLAAAVVVRWTWHGNALPSRPLWLIASALVRVSAGATIWLSITVQPPFRFEWALAFPAALAWIAALPLLGNQTASPVGPFLRVLIPALAIAGTLQAYPVAGNQVYFGGLLFTLVGAMCIGAGLREARLAAGNASRLTPVTAAGAIVLSVAIAASFAVWQIHRPFRTQRAVYRGTVAFPFSGATRVRAAPSSVRNIQALLAGIHARCGQFLTLPGLNSLYLWSGITPPTGLNAGDWMYLLSTSQQERVVENVRALPKLCVVRRSDVLASWNGGRRPPRRPLLTFIEHSFRPTATYGPFELLERRANARSLSSSARARRGAD